MLKQGILLVAATAAGAVAIPLLPGAMSSAIGDGTCLAETIETLPEHTAPPGTVDATETTPPTSTVVNDDAIETTPSTVVDVAPPSTGGPDVVTGSIAQDSSPLGLGGAGGPRAAVDPAPPPRQIITIDAKLWVDQAGRLGIHLSDATGARPDPCGAFPGATISQVPGLPGKYVITLPALKGRDCRKEDLVVTLRTKTIPASITYNGRDEPEIRIEVAEPHNASVEISMKCTVLVRR